MKTLNSNTRWNWARRLTALSFMGLLVAGRDGDWSFFKGSTAASETMGKVPLVDPLAAIEVALAQRSFAGELWLGAGILVGVALILGPIFCGWICPLGFLMDLTQSVRNTLQKRVFKKHFVLPDWSLPRGTRAAVLIATLAFALVAQVPLFQALSPIHMVARALIVTLDGAALVILALLLVEFVAPRLWCRSLCPLGATYAILGRFAPFRVRIHPERAGQIRCSRCEVACPMGIRVMGDHTLAGHESVSDPSCTRCGACIDTCPNSVLRLGFSKTAGVTTKPACELCGLTSKST
ncbi:MAG: 4Fe-4S binding protein [Planctomycetes bacterium]|nr:4Fe-4S binding protein [Planctomycetota bacterium]